MSNIHSKRLDVHFKGSIVAILKLVSFFKKNLLTILVTPLLLLLVAGSFYRFVILHDYLVSYEIECDPTESSCYVGCEDDECTQEYYYAIIERRADELRTLCGPDITECDEAYSCSPNTNDCEITYCDLETEDCSELIESFEI